MTNLHTLAFEIGTEEIPAFDLDRATTQLHTLVPAALDALRIPYSDFAIYSSPRRLIAIVEGVADETQALVEEHKGPSVAIAFDAAGAPTKAACGFARGKGIDAADLERRIVDGNEYVFATSRVAARPVRDLLPEALASLISAISWPKSCRWGTQSVLFSRPVRWLVALLDEEIIPVRFADLVAGNTTRGHRVLAPGDHVLAHANDLIATLRAAYVLPSQAQREEVIRAGVAAIEASSGCVATLPDKTLLEVINLCEYPTVLAGVFDQEFLQVPEEIIVDAMLMHQRYFPLYDTQGKLTNTFIIVSNGDPACAATIIDGNERVVRARLSDAKFFYEEDLKHPLDYFVDRLDKVVFQEALGTVRAKTDRLVSAAERMAAEAGLGAADAAAVCRAAYLCKADLVTNAVVEFTSVQGVMGAYYAQAAGEEPLVVEAIAQHYRPRFAGDEAPFSVVGRLVATLDKLDTICGMFAAGLAPSGSSDPFALRRQAIGIVNMLADGLSVRLEAGIDSALAAYTDLEFDAAATKAALLDFFITRTKVMLRDSGFAADVVDAVLAAGVIEPAQIVARTRALQAARADMPEVMDDLAVAFARANNLREEALGATVDESLLGSAEHALYQAVCATQANVEAALEGDDYAGALKALGALRAPIDTFFEEVLIMDENEALKNNRLRLLNRFVSVFSPVADFGKLS
ncbi:MAG: glycine--tRNA ligase subunit beta [Raoultibacter sp.]